MFEEFYKRYPRRVKPLNARKAYDKALRIATHEEIMDGLEKFIQAEPWRGDLQWCPHPATWLNAGEWMNEYEAAPVEKSYEQQRQETELYSYLIGGEWRGPINRKPTIEEARERLVRAGWKLEETNVVRLGRRTER